MQLRFFVPQDLFRGIWLLNLLKRRSYTLAGKISGNGGHRVDYLNLVHPLISVAVGVAPLLVILPALDAGGGVWRGRLAFFTTWLPPALLVSRLF